MLLNQMEILRSKLKLSLNVSILLVSLLMGIAIAAMLFLFKSPDYSPVHLEMRELAKSVQNHYQKRPDYWGLNTQKTLDEKFLPEKFYRNNKLMSTLGREIIIGSDNEGNMVMPSGRQFVLTIPDVSRDVCVKLAKSVQTAYEDPALDKISIQNDNGTSDFDWSENNHFSKLAQNAKSICKNRNTISWTFN